MSLDDIKTLIKQRIGLDHQIMGEKNLLRAINQRCLYHNNLPISAYWQKLQASNQEFQELIELILIPETWFFRDYQPFEFLKEHIRSIWLNNLTYTRVKGLSIPCSTGEEPYSLAMALLESGLSPYQLSIDAIDLSEKALKKAKEGIYGKNAFRGQFNLNYRQYFEKTPQGDRIKDIIRSIVNFHQGNILNLGQLGQNRYDFIFCRNLLIYLTPDAVNQVVTTLHQLLQPNGLLFVGASEMAQISGNRWQNVGKPFTFAYYKVSSSSHPPREQNKPKVNALVKNQGKMTLRSSQGSSVALKSVSKADDADLQEFDLRLAIAQKLGDEGKVDEAIEMCQQYLKTHPMIAEAYALLGALYEANSQAQLAEQSFNKALYLNPHCYEALVHLALLKEKRGDQAGGEILRRRIAKLNR